MTRSLAPAGSLGNRLVNQAKKGDSMIQAVTPGTRWVLWEQALQPEKLFPVNAVETTVLYPSSH